MRLQPEVVDDLRIEQRHGVGGDGIPEAREKLLRHRRPADDMPPLQHGDLQPRLGEIGGADEPVMPTPDDDDVGFAAEAAGRPSALNLLPLWEKVSPKATDEGDREANRATARISCANLVEISADAFVLEADDREAKPPQLPGASDIGLASLDAASHPAQR